MYFKISVRETHDCSLSRITTRLLRCVRFFIHFIAVQAPWKAQGLRASKTFIPHLQFYSKQTWIFMGMSLFDGKCLSDNLEFGSLITGHVELLCILPSMINKVAERVMIEQLCNVLNVADI